MNQNKEIEDKAKEIMQRFQNVIESPLTRGLRFQEAKEISIIHVEGIIEVFKMIEKDYHKGYCPYDIEHYNQLLSAIKNL